MARGWTVAALLGVAFVAVAVRATGSGSGVLVLSGGTKDQPVFQCRDGSTVSSAVLRVLPAALLGFAAQEEAVVEAQQLAGVLAGDVLRRPQTVAVVRVAGALSGELPRSEKALLGRRAVTAQLHLDAADGGGSSAHVPSAARAAAVLAAGRGDVDCNHVGAAVLSGLAAWDGVKLAAVCPGVERLMPELTSLDQGAEAAAVLNAVPGISASVDPKRTHVVYVVVDGVRGSLDVSDAGDRRLVAEAAVLYGGFSQLGGLAPSVVDVFVGSIDVMRARGDGSHKIALAIVDRAVASLMKAATDAAGPRAVLGLALGGRSSGRRATERGPVGVVDSSTLLSPYTYAQISEFQIILWSSLGLALALGVVLYCMCVMDQGPKDPVLYSQFKNDYDLKRD